MYCLRFLQTAKMFSCEIIRVILNKKLACVYKDGATNV